MGFIVSREIYDGLAVQKRVVWALMLRETKTLFGKHKLGYLWAVIETLGSISVFLIIRQWGGISSPDGLTSYTFLLGGFVPFYLFTETMRGSMNAIVGNRALLVFPQVFPIDMLYARALLNLCMYVLVSFILCVIGYFIGTFFGIDRPAYYMASFFFAVLLGFTTGLMFSSINVVWPTISILIPMTHRVLLFTSGTFFSVVLLPQSVRKYFWYNPLSHIIEMARGGFSSIYPSEIFVSYLYVTECIVVTLFFGLIFERLVRNSMDYS